MKTSKQAHIRYKHMKNMHIYKTSAHTKLPKTSRDTAQLYSLRAIVHLYPHSFIHTYIQTNKHAYIHVKTHTIIHNYIHTHDKATSTTVIYAVIHSHIHTDK
jgi:hypothetical protein